MTAFFEGLYDVGVLIACIIAIRAQWRQFTQNVDQWDAHTNPPNIKQAWLANYSLLTIVIFSYCVLMTVTWALDLG